MGIQDLQRFLENPTLEGGSVSVDLLKIARNVCQRQQPHNTNRKIRPIGGNKLRLIIDAENCLDRLYGGYYSDWACGGQWNRMVQYLSLLCGALEHGNIEVAIVFNGTIEQCRMEEWKAEQANIRQKIGMVLKHVNTKGTPPPKIWWAPPISLRASLRMALRHLGVHVMCTMDDHHQEVIAYCREYGFHGLLADDAEYAAFDPPRYFSSENLKLTYKGSIETKEYMLSVLTKKLNITQEQVCVTASLLGNFLLPENELQEFYKKIGINAKDENDIKSVASLAEFVRNLPSASNMDALVKAVFGSLEDKRSSRFKQSVQYYLNGTASGFLKYGASTKPTQKETPTQPEGCDESGFASETSEQQIESLQNYNLLTANTVLPNDFTELDILLKPDDSPNGIQGVNGISNGNPQELTQSASETVSSVPSTSGTLAKKKYDNVVTPTVSPDVLRTASLRHQKGLMVPTILHVLSTQELRLPCIMEDEANREFPPIYDIYLLLRKRVYAVLFNLHHLRYVHTKKKENGVVLENSYAPDIIVKEWVYSRSNPYQRPELIKAEPLPWAVPTLQRLWFGPGLDDKRRRMRAFLSCLNSDTPLILNTSYVPQHMLMMACVLRYIMSQDQPIMRRNELDAFLCQAFNPNLMNVQHLQELTLNVVTSRGVQLAALFMKGVDLAVFANDACGAPLPWLMCCPWLYFDGKLFHYTLARSSHAKNILEVCDNHVDRVVKIERMRKAILEGIDVKFAKLLPLTIHHGGPLLRPGIPAAYLPALPLPSARPAPNLRGRGLPARGGQLQVAGVVVGSWGANYGFQNNNLRPPQMIPPGLQQSVQFNTNNARGGGRGGRGGYTNNYGGRGGRGAPSKGPPPSVPSYPVGNKKTYQANKKRITNKSNNNKERQNNGLPLTAGRTDENGIFSGVPVNNVLLEEAKNGPYIQNQEDSKKSINHKGQGDVHPNSLQL